MATGITASPNLRAAFHQVNKTIFDEEYVVVAANKTTNPKEPVYLQLKYPNGKTRNIGIVHLMHLKGEEWDNAPFTEIAKTTEEVANAILARIIRFFAAEVRRLYIEDNGMIFNFHTVPVKIHANKTFSINGIRVTLEGSPFPLTHILSEGVIKFKQLKDGFIHLVNENGQRKDKGLYIDPSGIVY
jgi:hypothetical protein